MSNPSQVSGGDQKKESEEQRIEPLNQKHLEVSPNLLGWLQKNNCSVALTSYQSGSLYLIGRNTTGGISIQQTVYPHAMGIAVKSEGFVMATIHSLIDFQNILKDNERVNGFYNKCYAPRVTHFTGALDAHDVVIEKSGRLVFVNSRYSCLATPSQKASFKPVWKPDFVSELVAEDRCHLNGVALRDGKARYVTCASKSDTLEGWRDRRHNGGVLIDIETGRILAEGLSMPHSPRYADGKLWFLNSGTGDLSFIDPDADKPEIQTLCFCPGFTRGLTLHNGHALVGLSKPRYKRFEGLKLQETLDAKDSDAWAGFQILNAQNGKVEAWLRFEENVAELYDIAVLPNVETPMAMDIRVSDHVNLITIDQ